MIEGIEGYWGNHWGNLTPSKEKRCEEEPANPEHYKNFCGTDKEVIDVIKFSLTPEEFKGHLKCCAIKYTCRAGLKGVAAVDLEKRDVYLKWLKEVNNG